MEEGKSLLEQDWDKCGNIYPLLSYFCTAFQPSTCLNLIFGPFLPSVKVIKLLLNGFQSHSSFILVLSPFSPAEILLRLPLERSEIGFQDTSSLSSPLPAFKSGFLAEALCQRASHWVVFLQPTKNQPQAVGCSSLTYPGKHKWHKAGLGAAWMRLEGSRAGNTGRD